MNESRVLSRSARIGRRIGATTCAVAVVGLGMVGLAGSASAATCGTVKNATVTNNGVKAGESHYTVDCSSGYVLVTGNVKDTKKDGHCIEAKVVANGQYWLFRACGSGTSTPISVRTAGSSAAVYTYRV